MQSRLRSVSVATFAGTFWVLAHATADEGTGLHDPPRAASAAHTPDHAPVEEERLSDEAELARVVGLVEAAKYEECAARLSHLLDPASPHPLVDPQIVETARIYHATCLVGLGKDEQADEPLRAAIRKNPQMRAPDSLLFPPRVVDRFLKVREQLYAELRATEQKAIERAQREAAAKQKRDNEQWAHMLSLERLARQEVVVHKNSRYLALVPAGVGQFENGNVPLGFTFLGSEAVLGAAAITSLAVFSNLNTQAARYEARGQAPASDVNGRLTDWHLALTVSTYTLLGVAAVGIVEAQLSFVPEVRHVRERPQPKPPSERTSLSITPDFAVGPRDVTFGVHGAF
jgi:hypothetical protein